MREYHIRRFSGIETKYSEVDQDRGTLRVARGVNLAPTGALSFGPFPVTIDNTNFLLELATSAKNAGIPVSRVIFSTFTHGGHVLLFAHFRSQDSSGEARILGLWHVKNGQNLSSDASIGGTFTHFPTFFTNRTTSQWFGSWIGDRLFLGNGLDINLVYEANELRTLGPSSEPTDLSDPSRVRFPPCTSFVQDSNGVIYGAGNLTGNALRVWASDRPTAAFPRITALRALEWAYVDIHSSRSHLREDTKAITGLSFSRGRVAVHIGTAGCILVDAFTSETNKDGWRCNQYPTDAAAGAANPACVQDYGQRGIYWGTNGEVFETPVASSGYNERRDIAGQILTNRSPSKWNKDLRIDYNPLDQRAGTFTIYDETNRRFWMFSNRTQPSGNYIVVGAPIPPAPEPEPGTQPVELPITGLCYCYDQDSFGVTGPFYAHAFIAGCRGLQPDRCFMFGVLEGGRLVWMDLTDIGARQQDLAQYETGATLASWLGEQSTPVTAGSASPVVIISSDKQKFAVKMAERNGTTTTIWMSTPWADFTSADGFNATGGTYIQNAHLSVIELNTEDMGMPSGVKEFSQVRLHWQRNSVAHVGVFAEGDGLRVGKWRGTRYPRTEQVCPLGISARSIKLRIIVATVFGQPALLDGLTIDWLPGAAT